MIDDDLYLYSERSTLKTKNLRVDPRAVVHLESGDDVVIVHGQLDDVGHPMDFPRVVDALAEKYNTPMRRRFLPSADPDFNVLYLFRPRRALLWLSQIMRARSSDGPPPALLEEAEDSLELTHKTAPLLPYLVDSASNLQHRARSAVRRPDRL